jgi:hypothetical protein
VPVVAARVHRVRVDRGKAAARRTVRRVAGLLHVVGVDIEAEADRRTRPGARHPRHHACEPAFHLTEQRLGRPFLARPAVRRLDRLRRWHAHARLRHQYLAADAHLEAERPQPLSDEARGPEFSPRRFRMAVNIAAHADQLLPHLHLIHPRHNPRHRPDGPVIDSLITLSCFHIPLPQLGRAIYAAPILSGARSTVSNARCPLNPA